MKNAFTVLRFSPNPEEREFVNVAVILWGEMPELLMERTFPKLRCISPDVDPAMVAFYLEDIARRLMQAPSRDQGMELIRRMSSQFAVAQTRDLTDRPTDAFRRMLRQQYLMRPRHGIRAPAKHYARIETRLEHFMMTHTDVAPKALLRRASPADFVRSARMRAALSDAGIQIARVVDGRKHCVLIEGLAFEQGVSASVHGHANRIAYNYYTIRKAMDRDDDRKLHFETIVFDEMMTSTDHAAEHLVAFVREHSDVVSSTDPGARFKAVIQEAVF